MPQEKKKRPESQSTIRSEVFAKQFAWIDWLNDKFGTSDKALAQKAELTSDNYIYRNRDNGTVLSSTVIEQLCLRLGVPGPDTYLLPGVAKPPAELTRIDPAEARDIDPLILRAISLALEGRQGAVAWRLNSHVLEDDGYQIGDILITDEKAAYRAGDAVIARILGSSGGSGELAFRQYHPPFLYTATRDPALRMPVLIDQRVEILAPVTQSFRGRRH